MSEIGKRLYRMYRVWHKEEKRYIEANFSISPSGHLHKICGDEDGTYEIELDTKVFVIERCAGTCDDHLNPIYENDVVSEDGKFWLVVWYRGGWFGYRYVAGEPPTYKLLDDMKGPLVVKGNLNTSDENLRAKFHWFHEKSIL